MNCKFSDGKRFLLSFHLQFDAPEHRTGFESNWVYTTDASSWYHV